MYLAGYSTSSGCPYDTSIAGSEELFVRDHAVCMLVCRQLGHKLIQYVVDPTESEGLTASRAPYYTTKTTPFHTELLEHQWYRKMIPSRF